MDYHYDSEGERRQAEWDSMPDCEYNEWLRGEYPPRYADVIVETDHGTIVISKVAYFSLVYNELMPDSDPQECNMLDPENFATGQEYVNAVKAVNAVW